MVYNSREKKLPFPWQTAFVMFPQNDACDVQEMANKATHEVNMSEQRQHVVTQLLPHTNYCTDQRFLTCLKVAKCKKNKKSFHRRTPLNFMCHSRIYSIRYFSAGILLEGGLAFAILSPDLNIINHCGITWNNVNCKINTHGSCKNQFERSGTVCHIIVPSAIFHLSVTTYVFLKKCSSVKFSHCMCGSCDIK